MSDGIEELKKEIKGLQAEVNTLRTYVNLLTEIIYGEEFEDEYEDISVPPMTQYPWCLPTYGEDYGS